MAKRNRNILIGAMVLVIIIGIMAAAYQLMRPATAKGAKTVTLVVVGEDQKEQKYEVQTDAEYLQQVMDEAEGLTYEGTPGDFGPMIEYVNGEMASYEGNGAYWGFFVNGEYCEYGITRQPVNDGDEFRIVFTPGA